MKWDCVNYVLLRLQGTNRVEFWNLPKFWQTLQLPPRSGWLLASFHNLIFQFTPSPKLFSWPFRHYVTLRKLFLPLFLMHVPISDWIAARFSVPGRRSFRFQSPPYCLLSTRLPNTPNTFSPEDGTVVLTATFIRKTELYTEFQPRKPVERSYKYSWNVVSSKSF
jgi:hypothetical protein